MRRYPPRCCQGFFPELTALVVNANALNAGHGKGFTVYCVKGGLRRQVGVNQHQITLVFIDADQAFTEQIGVRFKRDFPETTEVGTDQ